MTESSDSTRSDEEQRSLGEGGIEPTDTLKVRRSWLRQGINRLEVDRAVFFSISLRLWQVLVGPVSMVLIAQFLSREAQGYYYTFANLMSLQAFCELGLHGVISNLASHEWARLHLTADGRVAGEDSALARLSGIHRFMVKWYRGVSALFVVAVGTVGLSMFSRSTAEIEWLAPWLVLVGVNGLVLWTWAMTTLLEGCNQVVAVGRMRLIQGVIGSICVWISFALGWELWSLVAAVLVRLAGDVWLLAVTYREFFRSLRQVAVSGNLSWRTEILPLQWRMGLRGVFGYLAFGLFTPIAFEYHGPAEAGRMGMTWTALSALEQVAFAWIGTRTARFGMLVAQRDYRELDRVFFRVLGISLGLLIAGAILLCGIIASLQWDAVPFGQKIADRLLPWDVAAVFCLGIAAIHVLRSLSIYVLAHKCDPLLPTALFACGLTGLLVWYVGRTGGASHMALAFTVVVVGYNLPHTFLIWRRYRRAWQADLPSPSVSSKATGRR